NHAFVYSDGKIQDLGTLFPDGGGAGARGINNSGLVVGWATDASFTPHPFLSGNGVMVDLDRLVAPHPGINLLGADGINDAGQSAVNGFDEAKDNYAEFLLTPKSSDLVVAALKEMGAFQLVNDIPWVEVSTGDATAGDPAAGEFAIVELVPGSPT